MSTGECSPDAISADQPTTHDVRSSREVSRSPFECRTCRTVARFVPFPGLALEFYAITM